MASIYSAVQDSTLKDQSSSSCPEGELDTNCLQGNIHMYPPVMPDQQLTSTCWQVQHAENIGLLPSRSERT